jgi:hypothetical protein
MPSVQTNMASTGEVAGLAVIWSPILLETTSR